MLRTLLMNLKDYKDYGAVKRLLAECMWAADEELDEKIEQVLGGYIANDCTELLGCFENGRLAGIIGIMRHSKKAAEIRHLAVQEQWRGKGIGRKMVEELRRTAEYDTITAETDHDAVGFYRNSGFAVKSLGEKYPGVERFICSLYLNDAERS